MSGRARRDGSPAFSVQWRLLEFRFRLLDHSSQESGKDQIFHALQVLADDPSSKKGMTKLNQAVGSLSLFFNPTR